MNSLTVNLHLLFSSFYTPSKSRFKILVDTPLFPSDAYALATHIRMRGYDPKETLLTVDLLPENSANAVSNKEKILDAISKYGDEVALVFFSGVNYLTGEVLPMAEITKAAHAQGCMVGLDLAHAVGNVTLQLHDWDVDFALWCHYKYLCSGPGSTGGAFVHQKHFTSDVQRLAGWWGHDPQKRFQMDQIARFEPAQGAAGWQLSTPSIIAATPVLAALEILQNVDKLPDRFALTQMLRSGLQEINAPEKFTILTPKQSIGSAISIVLHRNDAQACLNYLADQGVVCDLRPPQILRMAPIAAYSNLEDVQRFLTNFEAFLKL